MTPKCIRTDNGLNFFNKDCHDLLSNQGIIHQSSCAYSPQQNCIIERKHRHILEVARALKHQSNIPTHFWGYYVQTAIYIINELPTAVLKGQSSFEKFFAKPPFLNHLKVFGCLAYATILPSKGKLHPRAAPSFFLGYSLTQKGYILHNLSTHYVFVTRDVIFYENVSPFALSTFSLDPFPIDSEFLVLESIPTPSTYFISPHFTANSPVIQSTESIVSHNSVPDHSTPFTPSTIPISPPALRRSSRHTNPSIWA